MVVHASFVTSIDWSC